MATLNKDIFGLTVENHELVKLAYDAYLANSRSSHAKTLKRGEVRGGGKKPWRQKGTGRARFGSTRNPIWRHGGVAFGRTGNEYFTKKIERNVHGTGDVFSSVAIAELINGKEMPEVLKSACEFVVKAIEKTLPDESHGYGVKFESVLAERYHS